MSVDQTYEKVVRTNSTPAREDEIYPEIPANIDSGSFSDQSALFIGGGGVEEDQDFDPTASFSITTNGTTSGGVQTSPITIKCLGGLAYYPKPYATAQTGSPAPQTVTVAGGSSGSGASISVSPPSSGTTIYRIFATCTGTRNSNGVIDMSSTGTISIIIGTDVAVADLTGSNTRYKATGISTYDFYFLIGSIAVSRRSDGKFQVYINQVQLGDYTYGPLISKTETTAGSVVVPINDGLREFTFCINGEAFTGDFEVSNIQKV